MVSWQDVRDLGVTLWKKVSRSRTLWISGGSGSIVGLFAFIFLLTGVTYTYTGDSYMTDLDLSEDNDFYKTFTAVLENDLKDTDYLFGDSYVNVTSTYWRICFEESNSDWVDTNPNIKTYVLVPTYGRSWRLFNYDKDCIERKNKANPLPNRFRIIGIVPKSLAEADGRYRNIKWSYIWDTANTPGVNIDPIWMYDSGAGTTFIDIYGQNYLEYYE